MQKPASEEKKRKARILANLAQQYGFLVPLPCERCGAQPDHKHHEDYNRPLDVVWLCRCCHIRLHVQDRDEAVAGVITVLERFLADDDNSTKG